MASGQLNPNLSYWRSLLIAVDQLLNTLFMGYPDETISSRAYRCRHQLRWALAERTINVIFWWDRKGGISHCQLSYEAEVARKHTPFYGTAPRT